MQGISKFSVVEKRELLDVLNPFFDLSKTVKKDSGTWLVCSLYSQNYSNVPTSTLAFN